MTTTLRIAFSGLASLSCLTGLTHAQTLSSNLANTSAGSLEISHESWQAQQFTTDGLSYALDNVTLLMSRESGDGAAVVQIWSHDTLQQTPDSPLFTLVSPGSYSSGIDLSPTLFTPSGQALLAPNVSYWVVLKSDGAGTLFNWSWTADTTGSGPGFSPLNSIGTVGSGVIWDEASSVDPYQMQVNATAAVPEPTHVALWTLALAAPFGVMMRRNRRRASASSPADIR